jgi:hypothetical protein
MSSVNDLIEAARAARERGLSLTLPRLPNMEHRTGVHYVIDLSRRLTQPEIALLGRATEMREQALVKARGGSLADARRELAATEQFVVDQVRSEEGRLTARSFQAAAEAFLEHVEKRHEVARNLLLEALALCKRLRTEYGHRLEIRRVHLARNIVRLVWAAEGHQEAWDLGASLLEYVWVADSRWPLGEATDVDSAERETLRLDERTFLTDQLLSEALSTILDARKRGAKFAVRMPGSPEQMPPRVGQICQLCDAALGGDIAEIAGHMANYFEGGPADLPMTWQKADRLFSESTLALSVA